MKIKATRLSPILIFVLLVSLTGCGKIVESAVQTPEITPSLSQKQTTKPITPTAEPTNPPNPTSTHLPAFHDSEKPKEEISPVTASTSKSTLKPIYAVGNGEVALTIDDGPTKDTMELLRVLKQYNTKVTFFFLGENAAAYPEAVTEAVYYKHEIGYHSNSHPKMTKMNKAEQEKEFNLGLAKLTHLDPNPVTLFRPPYGAYNNDTKLVTEEHKMSMVLWNEDPRDWSFTDPVTIAKQVLSQVHSGGIIVIHDHRATIAALPAIIEGIRKKDLKTVTIPSVHSK